MASRVLSVRSLQRRRRVLVLTLLRMPKPETASLSTDSPHTSPSPVSLVTEIRSGRRSLGNSLIHPSRVLLLAGVKCRFADGDLPAHLSHFLATYHLLQWSKDVPSCISFHRCGPSSCIEVLEDLPPQITPHSLGKVFRPWARPVRRPLAGAKIPILWQLQ